MFSYHYAIKTCAPNLIVLQKGILIIMKKIIGILMTLVMMLSVVSPIATTAFSKTASQAQRIVTLKKNYITNNKATFKIKGNKSVKIYASDILANGQSYYNHHAVSDRVINIIRNNARFDYTVTNKKGKVLYGGSVKNGETIKIKKNLLSTCDLNIVSRFINDGTNIEVVSGPKQKVKGNGKTAAQYGGYWIEY